MKRLRSCFVSVSFVAWRLNLLSFDAVSIHAGVNGVIAQLFLDAQELVVLRDAVGAGRRTGLDLAGIEGDYKIGDGAVLGFAGAV